MIFIPQKLIGLKVELNEFSYASFFQAHNDPHPFKTAAFDNVSYVNNYPNLNYNSHKHPDVHHTATHYQNFSYNNQNSHKASSQNYQKNYNYPNYLSSQYTYPSTRQQNTPPQTSFNYFPTPNHQHHPQQLPDPVPPHSHIIVEDLQSIRNLETTLYVTDSTQASDFLWERESGLNLNVGVKRINLLPELHDVDHLSDNNYNLNSPIITHNDHQPIRSVVETACR